MAYRKERILNDDEIEDGIEEAESIAAYAKVMGCTPALVSARLSRIRRDRGEIDSRGIDTIDHKIRYQPSRAQVLKLLASHGAPACEERWGRPPSTLLKTAR